MKITPLSKSFLLLSSVSIVLILVRLLKTKDEFGLGLGWNLFLASVPMYFALISRRKIKTNKLSGILFLSLWLLFFPNSAYIITDLIHLDHLPEKIWWYDSMVIFMTAFTGLLLGTYSLYVVHDTLLRYLSNNMAWVLIISVLLLSGFGIYLGRFLRFNSWDLFTSPYLLSRSIYHEIYNPLAIQISLLFGVIQGVVYYAFWMLRSEFRPSA